MRVALSNCNPRMDWVAVMGDESKTFPFPGKAYGPESYAASDAAMAWIEQRMSELNA